MSAAGKPTGGEKLVWYATIAVSPSFYFRYRICTLLNRPFVKRRCPSTLMNRCRTNESCRGSQNFPPGLMRALNAGLLSGGVVCPLIPASATRADRTEKPGVATPLLVAAVMSNRIELRNPAAAKDRGKNMN